MVSPLGLLAFAMASPSASYNAIVQEMRAGNLVTACNQAAELVQAHPAFFGGFHLLGLCETQRANLPAATAHFRQALALNPQYLDARVNLANNLARLGHADEAARQFAKVLETHPTHLTSLTNLAELELQRGHACAAAGYLRRAVQQAPQQAAITVTLAEALLGCNAAAEAESLLLPLESAYSKHARWNALAGEAAFRQGRPKQAIERLRRALELDPMVERYWMIAGELLLGSGSEQTAAALFETGLQNLPNSPALRTGLAVAYMSGPARTGQAVSQLQKALELDPHFEPALLASCRLAEQMRDPEKLETAAARWRKINPRAWQPDYFEAMARLLEEAPAVDPAKLLERAITLNPRVAEPHIALGKLLLSRHQPGLAVQRFTSAIRLNANDPQAYYQLAQAYQKLGDAAKAADAFAQFKQRKKPASEWTAFSQLSPAP